MVRAEFRYTVPELTKAARLHAKHGPTARSLKLSRPGGMLLFAGLGALVAASLYFSDGPFLALPKLAGTAASLGALLVLLVVLSRWLHGHAARSALHMGEIDAECTFSEAGWTLKTPHSSHQQEWKLVYGVVHHPEGLLLFPSRHLCQWFPAHGFEGPEALNEVVGFALDAGIDVEQVQV